jgi:NAD-dependent dihydropyrimidine dehydrogenase PreA subunit
MAKLNMKVDPELCSGCCTCVLACPINIKIEPLCEDGIAPKTNKVVMRVINGVCHPLNIGLCQAKKFKCNLCENVCPNGALKLIEE